MRTLCRIKITVGLLVLLSQLAFSQEKSISITVDDVPNTTKYQNDHFNPILLNVLDSLNVPFTIFINEDKVFKTLFHNKNRELLDLWIKNDQALIGNHTYSHSRYSEVGFDNFVQDIEQGQSLTNQYAELYSKEVKYFRFPFNDMGKDSTGHHQIRMFLKSNGYVIAPFTVESSDWMFDYVYQFYLDRNEFEKAKAIGESYVEKTLEMIRFFETLSLDIYKRQVKQIYLCHDNAINADFLAQIVTRLKQEGYKIVSFDESLTDPAFSQTDNYFKKWGITWFYRWMDTQHERVSWMKQEPDLNAIHILYEEIVKSKN